MNALDRWREILDVVRRRRLRTALTALSVAWGIFMLVVLLAAGNALATGVEEAFSGDALDSVFVNPGVLSKPWAGNPVGKRVQLDGSDVEAIRTGMPHTAHLNAGVSVGDRPVRHGDRQGSFAIGGYQPGHDFVENRQLARGRFLDADDGAEKRKVAVIGRRAAEALFAPGDDPIGAFINVAGEAYQVVGVFIDEKQEDEERSVTVPLSTAQLAFGLGAHVHNVAFTLVGGSATEGSDALVTLRRLLGARRGFAPDDTRALSAWNNREMFDRLRTLFNGIRAFVWLIGLGTILAGVVGVGNIMLISVAERTREIGVRKAVGATPSAIVRMIVEEALVMTTVSGYLGLVAAVAAVTVAARVMPKTDYFARPQVDLGIGLAATAVLVVAGILAGLFPARRAAAINPIAALRVE